MPSGGALHVPGPNQDRGVTTHSEGLERAGPPWYVRTHGQPPARSEHEGGAPCGSPPTKSQPVSGILYRLPGGDHPSATAVTDGLMQPTREHRTGRPLPAWPCSARGLPSHGGHPPCWWALTPPFHPCPLPDAAWRLARPCPDRWRYRFCGAFPGSPQVGVTHRAALWSPDFPRRASLRAAIARPTQRTQRSASRRLGVAPRARATAWCAPPEPGRAADD
jgi:hypothetical protein